MKCHFCNRTITPCQTGTCERCWNDFLQLQRWIDDGGALEERYYPADRGTLPEYVWASNSSPDRQR